MLHANDTQNRKKHLKMQNRVKRGATVGTKKSKWYRNHVEAPEHKERH